MHAYYAPPKIILCQIESVDLKLMEMQSFPKYGIERLDRYFSPYVYYVCTKPGN